VGPQLHETGVLASFGGLIMRNEVVGVLRGLGYAKWEARMPLFLVVGVMGGYTWRSLVLWVSFGHSSLRCTFVGGERGAEMGGRRVSESLVS